MHWLLLAPQLRTCFMVVLKCSFVSRFAWLNSRQRGTLIASVVASFQSGSKSPFRLCLSSFVTLTASRAATWPSSVTASLAAIWPRNSITGLQRKTDFGLGWVGLGLAHSHASAIKNFDKCMKTFSPHTLRLWCCRCRSQCRVWHFWLCCVYVWCRIKSDNQKLTTSKSFCISHWESASLLLVGKGIAGRSPTNLRSP